MEIRGRNQFYRLPYPVLRIKLQNFRTIFYQRTWRKRWLPNH